ncbi:hypothetical protein L7F22_028751 [Adiantum nelumboides]|nr:hypothetical protein [Adiantum nelumboides]
MLLRCGDFLEQRAALIPLALFWCEYVIRRTKKGMSLAGSRQSPMLSFHLPFAGSQEWTEQLCTEFVHDHTMRAIQTWAGCLPEFLMMQHFGQSVGAVQSLDIDACFCLSIVFSVEATYHLPRTMRGWSSTSAVVAFGCTPDYYASWYNGVDTFHAGQLLRFEDSTFLCLVYMDLHIISWWNVNGMHFTSSSGPRKLRLRREITTHVSRPVDILLVQEHKLSYAHSQVWEALTRRCTWGLGHTGQLGHQALQSHNREVLPRRVVSLEGVRVTHIACGGVHTCAVTESGALYTWGGGHAGQLGLGSEADTFSCYSSDVSVFTRRVPVILVPNGVQHVTCGQCHTLAAMKDGRLLGWGYNSCGQAATGKSSYAWYPTPIDWCVGDVRMLAAGGGHSAVLTQACNLKELCELKIADLVAPENAPRIKDVALRNHSDALA